MLFAYPYNWLLWIKSLVLTFNISLLLYIFWVRPILRPGDIAKNNESKVTILTEQTSSREGKCSKQTHSINLGSSLKPSKIDDNRYINRLERLDSQLDR